MTMGDATMDKAEFGKTLVRMAQLLSVDDRIRAGAAGSQFSCVFEITDAELKLYLEFTGSEVKALVGEPPSPPTVELAMESPTFHGLFTGEIDAMSAAMSGDMSFAGDAGPAMAIQDLMDEFIRCYLQAREEIQ
jgi:putative sterol carrier protein